MVGTQYLLVLRLLNLPTSGFYTHHPIYYKGWTQGGNPVPTSLEVTESTLHQVSTHIILSITKGGPRVWTQYLLALRLLNLHTSGFYTHHPIYHKGWTQGLNPVPTSLEVTESTHIRFHHPIYHKGGTRVGTQYLLPWGLVNQIHHLHIYITKAGTRVWTQ